MASNANRIRGILSKGTIADPSQQSYRGLATEKHGKGRTKTKEEAYRSSSGGDGAAASLQSKIQSPPVISGRGAAAAARKVKMPYVGDRRRRRAEGRRRRSFSVPRSGGEAQEAEGQRKKKMVWGKKERFTPAPVFIPRDQGRGDRGKCSTTPTVSAVSRHVAARSGAAAPVTVPLGNDGMQ
jgi:hypothetical protein